MVLQRDYGQLGNRLHTHANAMAWCMENKLNLINLSFIKYAEGFSKWHGKPIHSLTLNKTFFSFLLKISNQGKLLDRLCRSDKWLKHARSTFRVCKKEDNQTIGEEELEELFKAQPQKKLTLVQAWDLSCPNLITKHQNKIREIFTPKAEFTKHAGSKIEELRKKYDCLVGVHARRKDYKEHLGGIYYHDWNTYRKWMFQIKELMERKGKGKVGFLLCSDDDPVYSVFKGLPVSFEKKKKVMTDLHSLSLCDYNIGPPSSFGTWLSWYGKVPRLHLEKEIKIHSLDQFLVCEGC